MTVRPWFAIGWYLAWGGAASLAVLSVLYALSLRLDHPSELVSLGADILGSMGSPVVFGPLSVATAVLLWRRHRLGRVAAIVAGGGILFTTLPTFHVLLVRGNFNLALGMFFIFSCTLLALWQVARRTCQPRV